MGWRATAAALHLALLLSACLDAPPSSFGGDGGPPMGAPYERTWVLADDASAPGPLYAPRMIYDPDRRVVLMYGGSPDMEPANGSDSMWSWDGAGWDKVCGPCEPGRRLEPGFAYDEVGHRALLFGGLDGESNRLGDLWAWDGSGWQPLERAGAPAPRFGHWMAYDPERQQVVVYGGDVEKLGASDETFLLDAGGWTRADLVIAPTPRLDQAASAGVDADGQILVYGGSTGFVEPYNDLWAWDGVEWSVLCTSCADYSRFAPALAYDQPRRRTLIIGGISLGPDSAWGTWEMQGVERACEYDQPAGRAAGGVAYDRDRDAFVYYGGYGEACSQSTCDDTFELVPLAPGEHGTCLE